MKGYFRRNKHGNIITTYADIHGRVYGKVKSRTSESYGGYTLSFKELRSNGSVAVRGVAICPPNKQIVRYAQSKEKAMLLLKRAIDGE